MKPSALKIHEIDEAFIDKVKSYNLFDAVPNHVVVLKILELDDSLVSDIKKPDIDSYDLQDFIYQRTGRKFGNYNFGHYSNTEMNFAYSVMIERIYNL